MTWTVSIHGPPGAGKTRVLSGAAIHSVGLIGPPRVGAMTYTRTAAAELKARISLSLGVDPRSLPYVGTIHGLCYAALGKPSVMKPEHYKAFCADVHLPTPHVRDYPSDPEQISPMWYAELEGSGAADYFRKTLATVRHSGRSFEEVARDFPREKRLPLAPDRMRDLEWQYSQWKLDADLVDFEDILELAVNRPPSVEILFVDEVQDNSRLMWQVIDRWSQRAQTLVLAGDPFQSLYRYLGADPELFMNHPTDRWIYLPVSHRLPPGADGYAQRILTHGGWDDPSAARFMQWQSQGGRPVDGSKFILSRTQRGLSPIKEQLRRAGTPYGELRGRGPLDSRSAQAWRLLGQVIDGELISPAQLQVVAQALKVQRLDLLKKARSLGDQDRIAVEWWLGADVELLKDRLPDATYFRSIEQQYGPDGLSYKPKLQLGTVHAGKGREADEVEVLRNWGWIPARAARSSLDGKKSEALVAYVGATRHRVNLNIVSSSEGGEPYRWPIQ